MDSASAGPAASASLPSSGTGLQPNKTLFISRAGADADVAAEIGRVLKSAGYGVILQQWDFANRHFMERMHEALAGGAHVVALLSPDYLRSDHCQAEWMNAIAGDPLNRNGRLILLRVAECSPPGLLAGLAYWDLVAVRDDPVGLAAIVCRAVSADHREAEPAPVAKPLLPGGTVTFLVTDVDRDARSADGEPAFAETEAAAIQTAIETHGGYLFRTGNDGMYAAFADAADAIAAAQAARIALRGTAPVSGPQRVRIAVHSGTADAHDGDYAGPGVNRAARLLALGRGGHILLSKVTADLARGRADLAGLHDMGTHRLKGLTEPEHIVALELPGARPQPLQSAGITRTNLPEDVKHLIGRESDVAEIRALLEQNRLVTLVGVGGLGKTSCSLKAAGELIAAHEDGVWFVDLAVIADPALVVSEVGAVFGVLESAQRPALETLTAQLRAKHMLIVLDNCEHVIDACSRLAAALLRACPGVSLLATSREALRVEGERVYHLPMLGVPESRTDLSVEGALRYGAIALFVARARDVDTRFTLTPQSTASVAEICRRLDGIPLAIELAAARVRVLAPRQLAARLDERFRILTGGARTALPRQQTMRALIDWSYDLLDERERTLFCMLSIFSGSFSLDSALRVCVGDDIEAFEVFDGLASLVDKSLVVADAAADDSRYHLLESIREYGRERLGERGLRTAAGRRHALTYAELAERLEDEYGTLSYRAWLAGAEREIENIRAALTFAFGPDGEIETGLRLAAQLRRIFYTSIPAEARRWVETALTRVGPDTPPRVVAGLELSDAHLASRLNQFNAALAAARRALAVYDSIGDRLGVAGAERLAGRSLMLLGETGEGEALLRRALATYEERGFRKVGALLLDLGSARSALGDLDAARTYFARALHQFEADQDEGNVAITAGTLAEAEFGAGDCASAVEHAQDALAVAHGLPRHITLWLKSNLSAFLIALDRFERARPYVHDALRLALDLQSDFWTAVSLQHAAAVLALASGGAPGVTQAESAARLTGFVDARLAELDVTREFTERQEYERALRALTAALGRERLAALLADGARHKPERALELALGATSVPSDADEPVRAGAAR